MFNKTLLSATVGAAFGLTLAAGPAQAVSIASTIFLGEENQWSDNSAESIGVDSSVGGSPVGVLDVGDTLRGTLQIGTIEDLTGGGGVIAYGAGGVNEYSAIFEVVVTAISVNLATDLDLSCGGSATCAGGFLSGDERVDYTFGAYAPFAAEFSATAGAVAVFFEDSTPDYDRTVALIATAETNATNGTKVFEIGFSDADDFWQSANTPSNTLLATLVPQGTGLGTFNLSMSILFNTLFGGVVQVPSGCVILPGGCGGDGLVDINGSGGISGTLGSTSGYDVFNNVDFVFQPIPEPGTFGMLGLGLVGLGLFLRRRQRAA
jgi:hypothetical protein